MKWPNLVNVCWVILLFLGLVGQGRPFERIGETKAHYFFGQYNSYASMTRYLRTIEFYYPHIARLVRIGVTHEGRPIEGLKVIACVNF